MNTLIVIKTVTSIYLVFIVFYFYKTADLPKQYAVFSRNYVNCIYVVRNDPKEHNSEVKAIALVD